MSKADARFNAGDQTLKAVEIEYESDEEPPPFNSLADYDPEEVDDVPRRPPPTPPSMGPYDVVPPSLAPAPVSSLYVNTRNEIVQNLYRRQNQYQEDYLRDVNVAPEPDIGGVLAELRLS